MRTLIKDLSRHKGQSVSIQGWVAVARNQGKMAFFDFRDASGRVQGVVFGKPEILEVAKTLRPEWVVSIQGVVNERPKKMVKEGVLNGDLELEITEIEVLNEAEPSVFPLDEDTRQVKNEIRLTHRYLDLRSERMQANLRAKHRVMHFFRNYLTDDGFIEIETPLLTKSTPEGARDYLVPSRLYPGTFFALPQSPQQHKQLLMTAGFERYFQIAKCLRDEDLRGDRQPEFLQLDLEMSFVSEEDILQANEAMVVALVQEHYGEKRIQEIPFPRLSYAHVMEKYGTDRPDLRENPDDPDLLAFCWVVDFPFFEKTAESDDLQAIGEWTFTHNPFSAPKPEHVDNLLAKKNIAEVIASQYDIVLNGFEIGGGSLRAHHSEVLQSILHILGHTNEQIEENFGHMIRALESGTPPHGGIAYGLDRLIALLQGEEAIAEVIAFPKSREARDPMLGSPSGVLDKQLEELGLQVKTQENDGPQTHANEEAS